MSGRWDVTDAPSVAPRQRSAPAPTEEAPLDPYVRWAMHTAWRGFARQAGWPTPDDPLAMVRIIGRVDDPARIDELTDLQLGGYALNVSPVYSQSLPGTRYRPRHFTATLTRQAVEQWLISNPAGLQWRLALEMRDAVQSARATPLGRDGPSRSADSLRATNVVADAVETAEPLDHPQGLDGALVLVDHGCPFIHEDFIDGSGTRVRALWDQGVGLPKPARPGWPWHMPAALNHGREMGPRALNAVALAARRNRLEETAVYRGIDYLIDEMDPRRRIWYGTHGGHLLDVAGGRPDPLHRQAEPDPAAAANLVFVQLPMPAALDSSGASLSAHLLDAVRYALTLCTPGSPIVVNISYGGHAGPHDGSSIIEAALDEVVDECKGNVALVLAAGNARRQRCHARREVRPDRSALLRMQLPAGDTTDTFVEIWYELPPSGQAAEFRVRAPNRLWSPWTGAGREVVMRDDLAPGDVLALLRHDSKVPNGKRGLALLAVAPTGQPDDVPCGLADAGAWEVEVRLVSSASPPAPLPPGAGVTLDAWIERDDPGRFGSAEHPAFTDQDDGDEQATLASIATGRRTFVVGGFNLGSGRPVSYSALGRPSQGGPDHPGALAACEESEAMPSIAAAATRTGEVLRLNGTSVAAPVLARRLYNHLVHLRAANPDTLLRDEADWRAALEAVLRDESKFVKPFARA
jgi:hypothetical protein